MTGSAKPPTGRPATPPRRDPMMAAQAILAGGAASNTADSDAAPAAPEPGPGPSAPPAGPGQWTPVDQLGGHLADVAAGDDFDTAGLRGSARQALSAAQKAIAAAPGVAGKAREDAERILRDADLTAEAKAGRIRELSRQAQARLTAASRAASDSLTAAEAELRRQALPALSDNAGMTARTDVLMHISDVKGTERAAVMRRLAEGGDDAAALVASEWGRSALAAGGLSGDRLDDAHRSIVTTAITAAAAGTDQERAAAAARLAKVRRLRGHADGISALSRTLGRILSRYA